MALALFIFGLFAAITAQKILPQSVQIELINKYPQLKSWVRITKIADILDFADFFKKSNLPKYYLTISAKNLEKLEKNHREFVNGEFFYHDKKYKVEVRHKGFDEKHFIFPQKSWTVKFDKDELFEGGYKQINFTIPIDRRFLVEQFNNYRAKKIGLIPPESWFGELNINGSNSGVYFINHGFSHYYLTRQRRVDAANLYSADLETVGPTFEGIKGWEQEAHEMHLPQYNFADVQVLLSILKNDDQNFQKNIFNIVEKESFFKWAVHSLLVLSKQQDDQHNLRVYFDPSRGKFEFIPWDVSIFDPHEDVDFDYNPLLTRILLVPEFLHERNQYLWEYVKNEQNLLDDLAYYDQLDKETRIAFNRDRKKMLSNIAVRNYIKKFRSDIETIFHILRNSFDKIEVSAEIFPVLPVDEKSKIDLRENEELSGKFVINTRSFAELTIESIKIISEEKPQGGLSLYSDTNHNDIFDKEDTQLAKATLDIENKLFTFLQPEYLIYTARSLPGQQKPNDVFASKQPFLLNNTSHTFFISSTDPDLKLSDIKIILKNFFTGEKIEPLSQYVYLEPFKDLSEIGRSRSEFLSKHPYFSEENGLLVLKEGEYNINENIIIPSGQSWRIEPGVTLKIQTKASIVSYGPVLAHGTSEKPIRLIATDPQNPWGVFAVIDKQAAGSSFKYVLFKDGSNAHVNGTWFSGMLAAHFADITVDRSIFQYAHGDDALNIKNAKAITTNSWFYKNSGDAIDYDFINEGAITYNYFLENGNEAIDLGGVREILVQNNLIVGSADKGISIGEKTGRVIIFNNQIQNSAVGIAIKDLSEPLILNNTIVNNQIGVASYQKKAVFGPGKGQIINTIIWNNQKNLEFEEGTETKMSFSALPESQNENNNVSIVPQFTDAETNNFTLKNPLQFSGSIEEYNKIFSDKPLENLTMGILSNLQPVIPF